MPWGRQRRDVTLKLRRDGELTPGQHDPDLRFRISASGRVRVRYSPGVQHVPPVFTGRYEPGVALTGTIRESWAELLLPYLFTVSTAACGLAAVVLLVAEGWPGLIPLPCAAALGWLSVRLHRQRSTGFPDEAKALDRAVRRLFPVRKR